MTLSEFNRLKPGDIVSCNSCNTFYYVVRDVTNLLCKEFFDVEELSDIYNKDNYIIPVYTAVNYKYSDIVTDDTLIHNINEWLNGSHEVEPYEYLNISRY